MFSIKYFKKRYVHGYNLPLSANPTLVFVVPDLFVSIPYYIELYLYRTLTPYPPPPWVSLSGGLIPLPWPHSPGLFGPLIGPALGPSAQVGPGFLGLNNWFPLARGGQEVGDVGSGVRAGQ